MRLVLMIPAILACFSAYAGPLQKEAMVKYALSELADVAIANTRCKIHVPDTHFKTVIGLNRQGWEDESDANLAVVAAYAAGKDAFDGMSKSDRTKKCKKIAEWYRDLEDAKPN